ncbi:transporter substrate-binding domain-containing protein [Ancylobacter sp. 6x-1]|uniref:Transporter substrate-binding domain-containing protein n=1 Tax=Ancylobacter crimeensis TaxID=2579147 RepID=A0ABT0D8J1_9HYPH|nr:ABC transporter substrate-binding protein [Ancylobacter crimeensis]MCK0196274.1 transporter substrate-binding domain-containing protein [Ancylobacter crimeensis]
MTARHVLNRRTLLAAGALPFFAAGFVRADGFARADLPVLRIGTLKFGTLSWLIATIRAEGLDTREGFAIDMVELASGQATTVALQAGDIDLIVSDWLWAMRRRADGEDFRFAPFSNALGALMVAKDGPVRTLADLKGRKLGVAGGALDKSWLLLRAYGQQQAGLDLATGAEPVYGAPPLVNQQLVLGRVDAALTFWPFAARLDAKGFTRLLDVSEVIGGLGISPTPPLVGFVWRQRIEATKGTALAGFFRAAEAADRLLATSDAAWQRLRPLMQAADEAEFVKLRDYFRAGIPGAFGASEIEACGRLYEVLARLGGAELVGPKPGFDRALFAPLKA